MMDLLQVLMDNGCIIQGSHLVLSSGNHSSGYINLRLIADNGYLLGNIGHQLWLQIIKAGIHRDISQPYGIIGPRTLGQEFALATAIQAGSFARLKRLWCEMDRGMASWPSKMDFADCVPGQEFVIVDDILTTGQAVLGTKKLIEDSGGIVSAVIVVVDRSNDQVTAETLGVQKLMSLAKVAIETYENADCPLCAHRVPMKRRPGYGWKWEKANPGYPMID
ncbi:hypothetical protein FWF48_01645 [Candidatus Saccharibacteria bacterium]|nr:hypothetical protein [Candidatus Saccharibacteria bacterium]